MKGMTHAATPSVTVSVVSHGHGKQVLVLLSKIHALCPLHVGQVVLTLNVPEPTLLAQINTRQWAFELTLLQNPQPKGFGANHNAAFAHHRLRLFCVANPDIDFDKNPFGELIRPLANPLAGCSFPVQVDEAGHVQDHARSVPSPAALLRRHSPFGVVRQVRDLPTPDWVNGAFMLFRTEAFRQLGGFDTRYFMYCEDVDICLRLQLAGLRLMRSDAQVTHAAHRSSRVNPRHLVWHVVSLLRLWTSTSYRAFVRLKQDRSRHL